MVWVGARLHGKFRPFELLSDPFCSTQNVRLPAAPAGAEVFDPPLADFRLGLTGLFNSGPVQLRG